MKQPLFLSSNITSWSNTAARFYPIAGGGSGGAQAATSGASGNGAAIRITTAGTISKLRVLLPTILTQGSYTITLMKGTTLSNLAATGLTATVTSTTAVDLVNSVTVAEGDYLAWQVTPTGTPTAQTLAPHISYLFESTTPNRGMLCSVFTNSSMAAAPGCAALASSVEATNMLVAPMNFQLTKLSVNISATTGTPGTGNSRTFTLRKGAAIGSLSDTGLTVTITGTEQEKTINLTGSPISVTAGELLSLVQTTSGTPTAVALKATIEYIPSVAGQSILPAQTAVALSTSAVRYIGVDGTSPGAEATDGNTATLAPVALTFKSLWAATTSAPGTGKSRAINLRSSAAATTLTTTITESNVFASSTSTVEVPAGSLIAYSHTPTGTPTIGSYLGLAAVVEVVATAETVNFSPSDKNGQTFEGIRNTSKVLVGGSYSGTPTDVQVSLWDAPSGGNIVSAWTSASSQTGGVYSHTFTGLPVSTSALYQRVRDNGGTETASAAALYIGAVIVLWGQSQCQKLYTSDIAGLTPQDGMHVRVLTASSVTNVSTASDTITRLSSGTTNLAGITGSGVVAIAHQWHADTGGTIPLLIVTCAYQGTSIEYWVNDRKGDYVNSGSPGTDVTTLWGTSATTGLAWHMAAAAKYQATAVMMLQGTADVNNNSTYAAFMETLKTKFETLYSGVTTAPLFLVVAHLRTNDGVNTQVLREIQYTKATSGGNWRLCCWLLDWQMDGDGSPHQITGATGNIRGGTRIGRGLTKNVFNTNLDILGPQITYVDFVDSTRMSIDITFDRDIETPSGVTTGIPGCYVSTNSGTSWPALPTGYTASIQSSNVLRITSTGSAFPASTCRFALLRGIPFSSSSTDADYVGTEANMEANYLTKVIVDTTTFDSGRGMPAAPTLGTGKAVAQTVTIAASAGVASHAGGRFRVSYA